ncbi:hypothetical protein GGX14DRAFT_482703 [Mycena pura]|uniref:Uncharacterized protein n=1 Tax=Mycena pura TaxID=153505 RepID=A0AAD6UUP1_9AGAR|nr:hypothetical protein GGX14DRAFT_482703 [Mycena pura]
MSCATITPATLPRPSAARSNTMPSIERTLSVFRASISSNTGKGLRRLSGLRHRQDSAASSVTVRPHTYSSVDDSVPVFTIPDYKQPTPSRPPPVECSPLTVTRPHVRRSMTLPSSVRAMSSKALARLPTLRGVCDTTPRKPSVVAADSPSSIRTVSTASRRRRSSVSSVESFSSSEENVTLWLKLQALPSSVLGFLSSIACLAMSFLLPTSAPAPKRKFALRPRERKIVLAEQQERNSPRLPRSGILSPLSRRLRKRNPKQPRAVKPSPVDPKTLSSH